MGSVLLLHCEWRGKRRCWGNHFTRWAIKEDLCDQIWRLFSLHLLPAGICSETNQKHARRMESWARNSGFVCPMIWFFCELFQWLLGLLLWPVLVKLINEVSISLSQRKLSNLNHTPKNVFRFKTHILVLLKFRCILTCRVVILRCSPPPPKGSKQATPWGKLATVFSNISNPECHWYFDQ